MKKGTVKITRESAGNYLVLVDGEQVAEIAKSPGFYGMEWCLLGPDRRTYYRTKAQAELDARSRWDINYTEQE